MVVGNAGGPGEVVYCAGGVGGIGAGGVVVYGDLAVAEDAGARSA